VYACSKFSKKSIIRMVDLYLYITVVNHNLEDISRPANPFHARLVVEWHKYKAAKTNRM
jgi:hypothetical protein